MKVFGMRLKQLREKRKNVNPMWTQEYIAESIGVARPTYTAYENGSKQPPMETLNKIADLFDVSTDYLTGRTDDPSPPSDRTQPVSAYESSLLTRYAELIRRSNELGVNIAYYGGPSDEITEEKVEQWERELEEFLEFKARRKKNK